MALKIRRGSDLVRSTQITPSEGELIYTTDTKKVFVGDGATLGGIEISGVNEGTTNAIAFYTEPGQAVSATHNLTWDDTNNLLTVDRGSIGVTNQNTKRDMFVLSQHYNSVEGSALSFNRSRGSLATPTTLLAQDTLGTLSFNGYHTGSPVYDQAAGITSYIPTAPTVDGNEFAINFVSKTGTGPYYVTFSFVTQGTAPTPSKSYTISGNENIAYNGSWRVFSSTTSSMVLFYPTDPGVFGTEATSAKLDGIVVGSLAFQTRTSNGNLVRAIRVENNGLTIIGPTQPDYVTGGNVTKPYDPTHNGQLAVNTTVTSAGQGSLDAQIALRTYANTTYSQSLNINRFRGTIAFPTSLVSGDQIHFIKWLGSTGTTGTTNTAAALSVTVDNTVSAGKVPGAITISTTNATSGALVAAVKIDSTQKTTFSGDVQIDGTISTTKAPATYWNYDTSGSNITMTLGQTLIFGNFSGTVLVNCYNSGTVTQYFCGGGGDPLVGGSSKVTPTGTMANTPGVNGYTFTSTEAGIHSFYVVRTRTGA